MNEEDKALGYRVITLANGSQWRLYDPYFVPRTAEAQEDLRYMHYFDHASFYEHHPEEVEGMPPKKIETVRDLWNRYLPYRAHTEWPTKGVHYAEDLAAALHKHSAPGTKVLIREDLDKSDNRHWILSPVDDPTLELLRYDGAAGFHYLQFFAEAMGWECRQIILRAP